MPSEDANSSGPNRGVFRRGLGKLAEFLGEWFRPSALPRKLVLGFSWLILVIIGSVSGTWVYDDWMQSRHRIAVSDKFTIATLAIAFFAAVFALLAYQVSTGTPNLKLGIMFYRQDPYRHKLEYTTDTERWRRLEHWFDSPDPPREDPKYLWDDPERPVHTAYMWIDNRSRYPAKSPAVIMRFGKDDNSSMGLALDFRILGVVRPPGAGPVVVSEVISGG
jgi:hypothetical protein